MHILEFIQDLAVIMVIAGIVSIIFHRLKQPVVLGYIIAGVIIGPYTPPFYLIHDEETIKTLAELGVVFLLFSLGLEFSIKKLLRVGTTAIVAAVMEIVLMIWIGYQIGQFFSWSRMDSLFLGAILSVSSTTIIIKALDDLKLKREPFAQIIFGILIVEDILAIGMIVLLSAVSTTGTISADAILLTIGKLAIFIVVALILGILLVPRLLNYVDKFGSSEMLLITVLGICFGFCLIVLKMGYSIALGAFIIGAVMAESRQIHKIEKLIEPIRDMFSAIFFVAIGLLLDPNVLVTYAVPVTVITFFVVIGKLISCGTGAFITGKDGRTSVKIGMGLSQIGEFSFIIASLGVTLKVTGDFIYPITVAVSAVTTLLTPYLIKFSDPFSSKLANTIPESIARVFTFYTVWLQNIRPQEKSSDLRKMIRRIVLQIILNFTFVITIFLVLTYFAEAYFSFFSKWISDYQIQRAIIWGSALFLSLPFLIAAYRKLQGLSMILAEIAAKPNNAKHRFEKIWLIIAEIIPVFSLIGMLVLIFILSSNILPTIPLIFLVLCIVSFIAWLLWKRFIQIHARLQNALKETLDKKD